MTHENLPKEHHTLNTKDITANANKYMAFDDNLAHEDIWLATPTYISLQYMSENPAQSSRTISKKADPNVHQRDPLQLATSSSKFLKRKPDHTKIFSSPSAKKRESSINRGLVGSAVGEEANSAAESRFITQKKVGRGSECGESLLLETAKSQNSLFLRKKELGMAINRVYEDASKISKDSFLSKHSPDAALPIDDYNHFGPVPRHTSKKSRTEFFAPELSQESAVLGKDEEGLSTQEQGELSYEERRLIEECESLARKNKWLEEQVEAYAEREYLLVTEKNHLEEQLREKERRITALQKEIVDRQGKEGGQERWREQLTAVAGRLAREEQRYSHLKEENDYMQTELIAKNEQLIALYGQHADQDSRHRKERNAMAHRFDRMKAEMEKLRLNSVSDSGQVGQAEKWKERALRLQQEIKYLQIQNQCLLMAKEELGKCEAENRKLRDERDYFKQKVMEHIKRNRRMQELSRSENSSFILELSETNNEHK